MIDFRIGDVIEFRDFSFKNKVWTDNKKLFVGRIDRIIHNISVPESDEWELWLEYYSEMSGAMYVTPERVVRVIEHGKIPYRETIPEFYLGTKVTFTEEKKRLLDEIAGYEYLYGDNESRWQYVMKYEGYLMGSDKFEVIK